MMFTAATLVVSLLGAFVMLYLTRLYAGLQSAAFVLSVLVIYSASVAIAAINYATKLDEAAAGEDSGVASRSTDAPPRR